MIITVRRGAGEGLLRRSTREVVDRYRFLHFAMSGFIPTFASMNGQRRNLAQYLVLALKGMAMGIAEVIPGVSGGTIAFITGIYEELLETIKNILGPEVPRAWRKGGLAAAWQKANGLFMIALLGGMATGLVSGVFGVTMLLERYPVLLWAFFFGLIIASAIYIGRQVKKWGTAEIIALVAGAALAFYITIATPAQGNSSLWFVFLSGMIAISAMILPGISGSFMLLLMGMYTLIIPTVKTAIKTLDPQSLLIVGTFGIGCLLGLGTFSRVLSWTFRHYHNTTLAALTGFMIGSLNKIWPWRNVVSYRENSAGEMVPFLEKSVQPGHYEGGDPMVFGVIILMIIGFATVFLIERVGTTKEGVEMEELK